MKANLNREHIEGYLYQHDLVKKVTGEQSKNPGTEYISGNIEIATDEEGLNVIPVHFTYVTAVTSGGKKSPTYDVLAKIIDEGKTWLSDGKDGAMKVSVNTAFAINDFYAQDGTLVSQKRNEGGFVSTVGKLNEDLEKRNTWEVDMLINSIATVDANEERGTDEYVAVRGYVFNFRNEILPAEFVVKSKAGMEYFDTLEASESAPIYTKIWGSIVNETIKTTRTEESGFGEAKVFESTRNIREWVVTGIAKEPYELGEGTITGEELKTAIQNRETNLAEQKKRSEEYRASKGGAAAPAPAKAKAGQFNF